MPAIVLLASQIIPLLISAGIQIAPVLERLFNIQGTPTDADWKFLHDQRDAAKKILFDTTRDV